MLINTSFLIRFIFWYTVNLVYFLHFMQTNDAISRSYKIVDNSKTKQDIKKNLNKSLHHSLVLLAGIDKNFPFRPPLSIFDNFSWILEKEEKRPKYWMYWRLRKFPRPDGKGECELAVFSAKRWDRRNRAGLIESATPCHDGHVAGSYGGWNPFHLTALISESEDYTTAPY